MPITNRELCGANEDIGWIWNFGFDLPDESNLRIQFGMDMGGGMATYINSNFFQANQGDLWWDNDWNHLDVERLDMDLQAGNNQLVFYGTEQCCDGPMWVRFSLNGQSWQILTEDAFNCAITNNCPGVSCGSNQYQDGPDCIDCHYSCNSCENADICYTCSDSNRVLPDCECVGGYYDEGVAQCDGCKNSCVTCDNSTQCTSCRDGRFLHKTQFQCVPCTTRFGNSCATCTADECLSCSADPTYTLPLCTGTGCLSSEYQVDLICKPCDPSCLTCSDSTTCTSCDGGVLNAGVCQQCSTTYNNCSDCTQFQCVECANNNTFMYPDCDNVSCEVGQTQDDTYNICWDCETHCLACSDPTTCISCIDGYYVDSGDCNQCTAPCATCSTSAIDCDSCIEAHYDPTTDCIQCVSGYYINGLNQCVSCTDFYGTICGQCDNVECTECQNDPTFSLPNCIETDCSLGYYKDDNICRQCSENCLSCSNALTCLDCQDMFYINGGNACSPCEGDCFLCQTQEVCELCNIIGFAPPSCNTSCQGNYYLLDSDCLQICPIGYYGDLYTNECLQCNDECIQCQYHSSNCTECTEEGKTIFEGQCLDCFQILGAQQNPDELQGVCQEICGDGIITNYDINNIHQCDDGNLLEGDGCNRECAVEDGWECVGGDETQPSICYDRRPIGFIVQFFFEDEYLNIDSNAALNCLMIFNKTFSLPPGKHLEQYIQLNIDGIDTSKFEIKAKNRIIGRQLLNNDSGLVYDLKIQPTETVRKRNIKIDLIQKSDFDDGNGNSLTENNEIQQSEVKDYFYYSNEERDNTDTFVFFMKLGVIALMLFLPFYLFIYDNHFNRFYVLFLIIDITQILYFYRFINIRWPINGIFFFRELKPVITFYVPNIFERDISEQEFEKYSSGVTKFDKERESVLFLNNTGSLAILLFSLILVYMVAVIFSFKRIYKNAQKSKVYSLFYQFRHGYLEWGIWFDSLLSFSGVIIIYIFLQLTNPYDQINFWIAISTGIVYIVFFTYCFIFTKKHRDSLYTEQTDEQQHDMPLVEKLAKNNTFKFRNIWHFCDRLYQHPNKAYFYFAFIIRKIYIAIVLLALQAHPKIQLSMFCFSHLILIFCLIKFQFFEFKSQTIKLCLSEFFVMAGVGCMYYLLGDDSEDESHRLKYCWVVLSLFLFSLFLQVIFFMWQEIIYPFYLWLLRRCQKKKVIDLRQYRKEGKMINGDNNQQQFTGQLNTTSKIQLDGNNNSQIIVDKIRNKQNSRAVSGDFMIEYENNKIDKNNEDIDIIDQNQLKGNFLISPNNEENKLIFTQEEGDYKQDNFFGKFNKITGNSQSQQAFSVQNIKKRNPKLIGQSTKLVIQNTENSLQNSKEDIVIQDNKIEDGQIRNVSKSIEQSPNSKDVDLFYNNSAGFNNMAGKQETQKSLFSKKKKDRKHIDRFNLHNDTQNL